MPFLHTIQCECGAVSINRQVRRSGDATVVAQIPLPAALAGTLTTRTDDDTGVVTVAAGHGITASDTVDVYWTGGRRYGVDVTAVTSTTISIDIGSGDNLPAASTAVTIVKQVVSNLMLDGDAALAFAFQFFDPPGGTAKCRVTFFDALSGGGTAVGAGIDLTANKPVIVDVAGGDTNLLTGAVILSLAASNGGLTPGTLQVVAEIDSTP